MKFIKKLSLLIVMTFVTILMFACGTKEYTIKWSVNGEIVETDVIKEGELPTFDGSNPTKQSTEEHTYEFNGWTPEVVNAVTDTTYVAEFTEKDIEFTITWVIDGKTVATDTVKKGVLPTYNGETPKKKATNDYTYTFKGWTPVIDNAVADATYTAYFNEVAIVRYLPSNVEFKSVEYLYDGEEHKVEMSNLPAEATVVYTNNTLTEPGSKEAKAVVTYYGRDYTYKANIKINKCNSTLTIAKEQTVESGKELVYAFDNEEQVLEYQEIYTPGVYYVSVYGKSSDHFAESNHEEVKVTVVPEKPFGITFLSTTLIADGTEKELLATDVPTGYHVEYENNKLTETGKTYAVCKVYDEGNNLVATINAIFKLDNEKNSEFEEFLNEFFLAYLGDDYFAWNIYSVNPESLGFDRTEFEEPEWYSYTRIDEEYRLEALKEFQDIYDELVVFKDQKLSNNQKIAYEKVMEFVEPYLEYYAENGDYTNQLKDLNYVDQFGGYCSDFATSIEGYTYRDEQDVIDVISYINSTKEVYPTYVDYVKDRMDAGYPLSDYTLGEMIDYLKDIVEKGEEYYLIEYIQTKINALDYLSDEKKTEYCNKVKDAFVSSFLPANQDLMTGLEGCKGKITSINNEGYWAKYDDGAELFIESVREMIGNPNLTIEEYTNYIDMQLNTATTKISETIEKFRKLSGTQSSLFLNLIEGQSLVDITKPEEMIAYLKVFSRVIVPELSSDPNVLIKYMDETAAEKSNAVAYYMRSAIDSSTDEYITLNPLRTSDSPNDTLATVAHEGYPGHLYAHVFSKDSDYHNILKVMSSTAYNEGWATYVELKLYDYIRANLTSISTTRKTTELAIDYLYYNQLAGFLLYNKIDAMIHLEHKSIKEISTFLDDNGYNGGAAEDIYRTLIEMPTGYTAYGYGMIFMNDLHIDTQKKLGDLYNEVDFNTFVLSTTQTSLYELKALTEEYIQDIMFMYKK